MRDVFHKMKWFALILLVLILAVGFARIFSGSEDGWIRDSSGRWVAHGHPAAPPPPADYTPPLPERVLPVLLLAVCISGLLAALFFSVRAPTNPPGLTRNLRFLGAVGISAAVLAGGLGLGLAISLFSGLAAALESPQAVILLLFGLMGLLALLAGQAHGTKKVLEAHYDLKRESALLRESIESLER
jgi:hypothetical protein